jgi:hypothetical protein
MSSLAGDDTEYQVSVLSASKPSAFDTFTLFPKLPVELRLVIWRPALPRGSSGDGKRIMCVEIYLNSGRQMLAGEPLDCRFRLVTVDERQRGRCQPVWLEDDITDRQMKLRAEAEADERGARDIRLLKTY